MSVLCIVTCGKRKVWDDHPDAGPTAAQCVYTGPFHRACQVYAWRFHTNAWRILSAKHGFLGPRDIVPENYDVSFDRPETEPISVDELKQQAREKRLTTYDRVVVLGGQLYGDIVRQVFGDERVDTPLEGLRGNGFMMHELNGAVERGEPFQTRVV
jgi:hypothetical protein